MYISVLSILKSCHRITNRTDHHGLMILVLYDVPMFMSLFGFGFGIGMMFASFHVLGMMLLFSNVLYMLV